MQNLFKVFQIFMQRVLNVHAISSKSFPFLGNKVSSSAERNTLRHGPLECYGIFPRQNSESWTFSVSKSIKRRSNRTEYSREPLKVYR